MNVGKYVGCSVILQNGISSRKDVPGWVKCLGQKFWEYTLYNFCFRASPFARYCLDGRRRKHTLQSKIIGKRLCETAPVGRGKLRGEIRVPISNNLALHAPFLYNTLNFQKRH